MYYLKPTEESILKGRLYKFKGKSKELIDKRFVITKTTDPFIKGSIICQWLAEGRSFDVLEEYDALPSKYEFLHWVETDKSLKILYESAKSKRNSLVIDNIYKEVMGSKKLTNENVDKIVKVLSGLQRHLKDIDSGPKTIINTRVFVPKILGPWYDKKDGVRTLKDK